jgi:hypothetical protein
MEKEKMLITTNNRNNLFNQWEGLQQPMHGNHHQADTMRLLAALDEGWQILETANYLAHGLNAEGLGYLLTLYNPKLGQTRELSIVHNQDIEAILKFEGATH